MSFVAIRSIKNYITSSADGFDKTMMSSQLELMPTETIKCFFQLYAFWNGPSESIEILSFGLLTSETFPNSI